MTDNTADEGLWLPNDIWANIASFLDYEDLIRFRLLCSATQSVLILQPLYNRLCALDEVSPSILPEEGGLIFFKQAFEKIHTQQQSEIKYLIKPHPDRMAEYGQVLQENAPASLQSLETRNVALDKINSDIIRARIDITKSYLNLDKISITRLPVALFQEPSYVNFWKNLAYLSCENNQLTALNVQGLVALQSLYCSHNQLTTLDVQGLISLQILDCNNNQLTELNIQNLTELEQLWCRKNCLTELNAQGLTKLKKLWCEWNLLTTLNVQGSTGLENLNCNNNPLTTLILTGVHANTKNDYAKLERTLLFNKLSTAQSPQATQAIIRRLGNDYTLKNCLKYCTAQDAAKLFTSKSVNSAYRSAYSVLAKASAFLPSFVTTNAGLKRKRDEEIDTEELSEEPDKQPALKKRKKK